MTLSRPLLIVTIAGLVAGTIAHFADPSGSTGALVFLAAGLVVGELLVEHKRISCHHHRNPVDCKRHPALCQRKRVV